MRERSQTTPRRRRGPKQPLPRNHYEIEQQQFESSEGMGTSSVESPYYTIDNTEDIYGTTLLPSQRCYVDPWDLENYDYVRKKIQDAPALAHSKEDYYDTALMASADSSNYEQDYVAPRMAATMPRPHTRRTSRFQCQMECCAAPALVQQQQRRSRRHYKENAYAARSELYAHAGNRYDDYMANMTRQLQLEDDFAAAQSQHIYNGYGGFSTSSSTEQHNSSIGSGEDAYNTAATMQRRKTTAYGNYGTAPAAVRKRSQSLARNLSPKPAPQIDFPAPPPLSPAYDYCNPYSTLPYCSIPDCYECQQHGTSLIYAAPASLYGSNSNTLGRGQSASPVSGASSLYAGIYANKFALSKKGLLQIDYSCSWNDLDRVMTRNY